MRQLAILTLLVGCTTTAADDSREAEPAPTDGVAPPVRDAASTAAWLATGEYMTWRCEDSSHPARPGSAHSRNRICSNELLATTAEGVAFPVGAAAVKELLDGNDQLVGHAFAEKARDSDGGRGWYWYEVVGSTTYAASYGASLCTGCHEGAHDYVFTIVR